MFVGNHNNFESLEECRKVCPVCPRLDCTVDCEYGYLNDSNGCPTCECKVKNVTCEVSQH